MPYKKPKSGRPSGSKQALIQVDASETEAQGTAWAASASNDEKKTSAAEGNSSFRRGRKPTAPGASKEPKSPNAEKDAKPEKSKGKRGRPPGRKKADKNPKPAKVPGKRGRPPGSKNKNKESKPIKVPGKRGRPPGSKKADAGAQAVKLSGKSHTYVINGTPVVIDGKPSHVHIQKNQIVIKF